MMMGKNILKMSIAGVSVIAYINIPELTIANSQKIPSITGVEM